MAATDYITTTEHLWTVNNIKKIYSPPEVREQEKGIIVPSHQRLWAWKNKIGAKKMDDLIDSIIMGFPIPTCILNRMREGSNLSTSLYAVYDGRHRIETIYRFANDKFKWKGKLYSELSQEHKDRFNNRGLPITVVHNATNDQLADIFIRLNKGVPLKDSDLFWANRHTALVLAVECLVYTHERLSVALGGVDLRKRTELANWAGLVRGLNTGIDGNISTSYIRACEGVGGVNGLNEQVDYPKVTRGLDAFTELLEKANTKFPCGDKDKRCFKKVGKLAAFFIAEWAPSTDQPATIDKWVEIIGQLRGTDSEEMTKALSTTGAQNLTAAKIEKVLQQVNDYIERGVRTAESASDEDEEDE